MPLSDTDLERPPTKLGILLVDGFSLMSYASIIEPFRAANVLSKRELYKWSHVAVKGETVKASNGVAVVADTRVGDVVDMDILFVIAGGEPALFDDSRTFGWLRRLFRHGVSLAGVSGGPYILARAGLLDGYRCTIHWDHAPLFVENFPNALLEHNLYVIDRRRLTCAGGSAGLDMSIDIVERDHGHKLAIDVSEWFIRTKPRPAGDQQRVSLRERYNVNNDKLVRVLAHMEATIEEPEDGDMLVKISGVSRRQLERLFQLHLQSTIGETYRRIRLNHADTLLRKTGLTVTNVAIACGFASISHFSRCYKSQFGLSPQSNRNRS